MKYSIEYSTKSKLINIYIVNKLIGLSNGQVDIPVYASRRFSVGSDITPLEIGIPRTHPINSYEQYNNQYTPYENTQYGNAQYGSLYPHSNYDQQQPDKRFMISRKRSQVYYILY